ncbi:MAG: choice-of-anchor tandem repeat GloVer-containing protein [Bryobacteraceae bacterium]
MYAFFSRTRAYALLLAGAAMTIASSAQTFTDLVDFNYSNGAAPLNAPLVQGTDGNLYGATAYGGLCTLYDLGCGSVFKMTPAGALTTLHFFNGSDGAYPFGGLLLDSDGSFYGTTVTAGANCASPDGCGTVFKISPKGDFSTLYTFCAQPNCADGFQPSGSLIRGFDGDLYGITGYGGTSTKCSLGCGTIFKITPGGALTTVYSFTGPPSPYYPFYSLLQATDGNLYGTTSGGGGYGGGAVFKVTPNGKFTTIYSFCPQPGCADGEIPSSGLIQAVDGDFYGTTDLGGSSRSCNGCGTIFKISPSGAFKSVLSFDSTDGFTPVGGLIEATDHNLYGTTTEGGGSATCPGGCGNIFQFGPGPAASTLYTFANDRAGEDPRSALLQATDGSFYGTTYVGGLDGAGNIFRLSTGLAPFVKTLPKSGKVGAVIRVLGTDLTGATAVSFNGVAAAFQVVSATEITATVPDGAATGEVQVKIPGATLLSGGPFFVLP